MTASTIPDGYRLIGQACYGPPWADYDLTGQAPPEALPCYDLAPRWLRQPGDPAGTDRDVHGRLVTVTYGPLVDRLVLHHSERQPQRDRIATLVDPDDIHILDGAYQCVTCLGLEDRQLRVICTPDGDAAAAEFSRYSHIAGPIDRADPVASIVTLKVDLEAKVARVLGSTCHHTAWRVEPIGSTLDQIIGQS